MHREVGFQRIAGTPARVGATPASFVERTKQELRELRRCERDGPMTSHGLPPLGHQRIWRILARSRGKSGGSRASAVYTVSTCFARGFDPLFPRQDWSYQAQLAHTPSVCARGRAGRGRPPFVLSGIEEPAPAHQRKDRQNRLLGNCRRRSCHLAASRPTAKSCRSGSRCVRESSFWPRSPEPRGTLRSPLGACDACGESRSGPSGGRSDVTPGGGRKRNTRREPAPRLLRRLASSPRRSSERAAPRSVSRAASRPSQSKLGCESGPRCCRFLQGVRASRVRRPPRSRSGWWRYEARLPHGAGRPLRRARVRRSTVPCPRSWADSQVGEGRG